MLYCILIRQKLCSRKGDHHTKILGTQLVLYIFAGILIEFYIIREIWRAFGRTCWCLEVSKELESALRASIYANCPSS